MKRFLSLSLLFFTLCSAQAQETWVGFKPVEEVDLPFKDYVENSIVLIDTVGDTAGQREKAVQIIDISKIKAVSNPKKLAPNDDPTKPQKNLKAMQIETCRKQNLRFCPVMKTSSMSTGFFEAGKKLNTCRHAFHNWLVWASKANGGIPVETLSPPMILYSKDWKIIYNSALVTADQLLKFSFLNTDPRVNILDFGIPASPSKAWNNYRFSDVAQLYSKTELVPAQNISYFQNFAEKYNLLTPETNLYLSGYPGKTRYFNNSKAEAPGGKLVVSVGNMTNVSPLQLLVQTNLLAKTGSSGSPLFTKRGTVVGITCSGEDPQTKDHPDTAKSLTFVFDPQALKDIWAKFEY